MRSHSMDDLLLGLLAYMRACEPVTDWRDVLVGFAPFHDCASRLGLDPAWVFDVAADAVGREVADLARTFGRRTDVTRRTFGYTVVDGPDGPFYRSGPIGSPER